uniref:Ionotropic receptor 75u n=1 Tax=Aulacocentrum confusum TaxID=2767324 RepID=A0A7G8Z9I5_9HYME|nr:ionotropic receptor 75u [Aulacocentrum confusum]
MKNFAKLIFICLVISSEAHKIDQTIGEFIIDVTSSMYMRSSFTAFFCIDTTDAIIFSRQISRRQVMHEIIHDLKNINLTNLLTKISSQSFFILDFDCPNVEEFLLQMDLNEMFIAPNKWLILQNLENFPDKNLTLTINTEDFKRYFEALQVYPDSEVTVGQRIDENFINIISMYRPGPSGNIILEDRGFWSDLEGLQISDKNPTSRRRQDLQGTHLKSCLVMTDLDTLNHLSDYKDKQIDAVTKANYIWVQHLVNRMNATIDFTWRNTWGYQDKNGTWGGMIGLLDRGEIDIGGTATFLISSRIGVVDYVQLYTPVGSRFVFRRPPLSYVTNLFTLPFEQSVWIAIGILLIVVSILLSLTMRWEWARIMESPSKYHLGGELESKPTASDNFLILLGAVAQQGFEYLPRTISSRIIIIMLLIAAFSLYASYTANIVALLQSTSDSINTIEDLMNSGLKVATYDIVYNRYYFGSFEDPVRKEFSQKLIANKSSAWLTLEEGVARLRQGLFAFHMDTSAGYDLVQKTFEEDEKCGLSEIDMLNVLNPMLVIKHQSPYSEIIRVGALWVQETGLTGHDVPRLFSKMPKCSGQTSFVNVGMTECRAAMLTIVYGMIASVGLFFMEILWHKCSRNDEIDEEVMEASEESPDPEIQSLE